MMMLFSRDVVHVTGDDVLRQAHGALCHNLSGLDVVMMLRGMTIVIRYVSLWCALR